MRRAASLVFPQLFFPSSDPAVAIVAALATYGVGYVARPVGAFVLGRAKLSRPAGGSGQPTGSVVTIRGATALVAHIGFPTDGFASPLICNPYFEAAGIDAVVVPMGCRTGDYPAFLRALFTLSRSRARTTPYAGCRWAPAGRPVRWRRVRACAQTQRLPD